MTRTARTEILVLTTLIALGVTVQSIAQTARPAVRAIENLSELATNDYRGLSASGKVSVEVLGLSTAGDGGGGRWTLDASDVTTPTNGITVIAAIPTGRWKREFTGSLDARWAGTKGDGVTEDTVAFQAAINAAVGPVLVRAGTYVVSNLTIVGSKHLVFEDGAIIKASGAPSDYQALVSLADNARLLVEGGTFDASAISNRSYSVLQARDVTNVVLDISGITISNYIYGGINLWNWSGSLTVDLCRFANGRTHSGIINEDSRAITQYGVVGTKPALVRVTRSEFINDLNNYPVGGSTPTGVYLKSNDGVTHAHIEGNYFDGCGTDRAGNLTGSIDFYQGVEGQIVGNFIKRSQGLGIKVQESQNVRIEYNTVDGQGNNPGPSYFFGIHWNPNPRSFYADPKDGVIILGNTVRNFTNVNSFAIGTSNNSTNRGGDLVIEANLVENCARGIYLDAPAGRVSITKNTTKDTTLIALGIFRPLTNELSSLAIDGNHFLNVTGEAGVTIEQVNGSLRFLGNVQYGTRGIGIGAGYGTIRAADNHVVVTNANALQIVSSGVVSPSVVLIENNDLQAATTNYYAVAVQNVAAVQLRNNRLTTANAVSAQAAGLSGPSSVWLENNVLSGSIDTSGATVVVKANAYGPLDVPVAAVFRTLVEFASNVQVTNRVGIGIQPVYPFDLRSTDAIAARWYNPNDTGADALTLYFVSGTSNQASGSLQAFHGGYADSVVRDKVVLRANTDAAGLAMRLNAGGQKWEVQNPGGPLLEVDYAGAVRAIYSFELPNSAAPTVDAFGEVAADNDAWTASRGALITYDGTAVTRLIGVLASDTPSAGQVPKFNSGGTITWEDDQTGAGDLSDGDKGDITVSGSGATWTIDGDSVALGTDTTGNYVATVAGTANEVSVSGSGSETAAVTLSLPSTIDLGAKTSFELPNGAAPTVDAFGEVAGDNDTWAASRGALITYDGTAVTRLVGVLASDTPSAGQVLKFNSGGTITWEDDNAGGGVSDGDKGDITVSGSGATWTIDADAVAMGADTTGNYVALIGGGTNVTVSGSASEGSAHTITIPNSGVTAGTYNLSTITVGADGRVISASSGTPQKTIARFTPLDNQPPGSSYATLSTRNSFAILEFDPSTEESATFLGIMPNDAVLGSGLTVKLTWMTAATSGVGRWGIQFMKLNTDLDFDDYATAAEATTATTSATSGIATTTSITTANLDSIAAGEPYRLRVYRDTSDAADTINSSDLQLLAVEVMTAN